ncbi:MAG: ATP-binding protein [Actinomycetota bacterium]
MSLRVRLMLISTVVLTVVIVIFGTGVYVLLERNLRSRIDSGLVQRADEVGRAMRFSPDKAAINTFGFSKPNTYIQIVDKDGDVVARSEALGPVEFAVSDAIKAVGHGDREPFTQDVEVGGVAFRVYAKPLVDQLNQPVGTVLVAALLDDLETTLKNARGILLLAGLAGIALAAGLSWRSARTALRPVEEIAATAQQIGMTGDLSRRVPAGGSDELGKLAEAFNTMLLRLESAQNALSRSLEIQRRFVDDASHELRTPLTIMRGNLEVVARNPSLSGDERAAALRDSIEEAERMTRLVDDLLALARVDAGMTLPDEEVALAPLVRAVADETVAAAGERVVSVTIGSPDARVRGFESLLRRLLENLADNAVKYTAERGTISISLVDEGDDVVVTFADDGVGMTPDEVAHAFDRFWRSDRSRERPGSGLGLAIAKTVAEAHGGTIEVVSEPDAGTTFTVRIPRSSGGDPAEPVITPSTDTSVGATIGGEP